MGVGRAGRRTLAEHLDLLDSLSNCDFVFKTSEKDDKRQMLENLLSNCQIEDGKLFGNYRSWFKLVADAKAKTGGQTSEMKEWLPAMDSNHD